MRILFNCSVYTFAGPSVLSIIIVSCSAIISKDIFFFADVCVLRSLGVCCLCCSVSLHVDVEKIYCISLSRACLLAVTTGVLSARRDRDRFCGSCCGARCCGVRAKDTACVYVSHESQCRFTGEPLYITTLENFTRANVRVCGTPQIELRSGIEES